ncbi:MAG TPA: hypothetical protein VGL03_02440 [Thermoanaerobaculia bacterium]|jgi:hypothetical protein
MARDEIAGREKRSGGKFRGPTGKTMTEERRRDRESATGRAGGTGRFIAPEEEDVPKKTPGTDRDKKELDEGGI